ncbi:MAG: formate dehydrogenase, alpha subunit, partial [Methanosaeta sp. ASP1-1]
IAAGDMVRVITPRGQAEAKARITEKVKPGMVFMPFHYHGTNILTSEHIDPVAKIPEYKMAACRIETMA